MGKAGGQRLDAFTVGVIWATGTRTDGQYVVRNEDAYWAEHVRKRFGGTVYTIKHPRNGTPMYCIKIKMAIAPEIEALGWTGRSDADRGMPDVDDRGEFCRAYIQCHASIDMWKHRTRRGIEIATPRMRIWAAETMLEGITRVISGETGAGIKKVQRHQTDAGTTYALFYQSPREVAAICEWVLSGEHSPRFAEIAARVKGKVGE